MPSPPVRVTLPVNPVLEADDSTLTRKFGQEVTNYYAGSPLNRYSFLRTDAAFLRRAAATPATRYVALCSLNPVVDKTRLATFAYQDVCPLIGAEPAFVVDEETAVARFDPAASTPLVVFLGLLDQDAEASGSGTSRKDDDDDDDNGNGCGNDFETTAHGTIRGQPYFALDATPRDSYKEVAEAFREAAEARGLSIETNPRAMALQPEHAAIYAQARSMIDWNSRNRFCAGCGSRNLSIHAGYKRVCPPPPSPSPSSLLLPLCQDPDRADCPTRHGISNICFPRTDPTMIAAVVSADGRRLLLGRQRAWPPRWHSTLAGFLEPGESVEDAVRREVWEESGVRVGRVVAHSTQPWPYPCSLMMGALAHALPGPGEHISLLDGELESARWFPLDVVRAALARAAGSPPAPSGNDNVDADADADDDELSVPPPQAIAHQLIKAVVEGKFMGLSKI